MNKGYIASLAAAAVLVLLLGVFVHPEPVKHRTEQAPETPPPTRRGQMRQISDFLSERVLDVADHIVHVPSTQASGVAWPTGQIVTTAPPPTFVATTAVVNEQLKPVNLAPEERFDQNGWVVAVARDPESRTISISGLLGGVAEGHCGTTNVRKLLLNTALDSAFAGGGVFDLSGDLLGTVVRCGEGWAAVTWDTAERLLRAQSGPEGMLWNDFGVHVRTASAEERQILRLPTGGLFVNEVRKNSRAFNIGIRPGDLLLRAGEQELKNPDDLLALGETLFAVREGRLLRLSVSPEYTLDLAAGGPVLTSLQPGTRFHNAGLRSGDRVIRVSGNESPGPSDLNRLLSASRPFWMVYERDDRRVWVIVR